MKTIKFSKDSWEYETKCRRCNSLTLWHFSDKKNFDWIRFAEAMEDHIHDPRLYFCDRCKINTIQDVTSYTFPK